MIQEHLYSAEAAASVSGHLKSCQSITRALRVKSLRNLQRYSTWRGTIPQFLRFWQHHWKRNPLCSQQQVTPRSLGYLMEECSGLPTIMVKKTPKWALRGYLEAECFLNFLQSFLSSYSWNLELLKISCCSKFHYRSEQKEKWKWREMVKILHNTDLNPATLPWLHHLRQWEIQAIIYNLMAANISSQGSKAENRVWAFVLSLLN